MHTKQHIERHEELSTIGYKMLNPRCDSVAEQLKLMHVPAARMTVLVAPVRCKLLGGKRPFAEESGTVKRLPCMQDIFKPVEAVHLHLSHAACYLHTLVEMTSWNLQVDRKPSIAVLLQTRKT